MVSGFIRCGCWYRCRRAPLGTPRPSERPATHEVWRQVAHRSPSRPSPTSLRSMASAVRWPGPAGQGTAVFGADAGRAAVAPSPRPVACVAAGAVSRPPGGAGSGCAERRVVGVAIMG